MDKQLKILAWPGHCYRPFNPYNWLLNNNLEKFSVKICPFSLKNILLKKYDIWHMHWPAENVLKPNKIQTWFRLSGFVFLLVVAKIKRIKIVWTAHNHKTHDNIFPLAENIFWPIFTFFVDSTISLSYEAQKKLLYRYPQLHTKLNHVIYHGHYKDWYPNIIRRQEALQKLDLQDVGFKYLFVGTIRPYKNITGLLNAFCSLDCKDDMLLIAGMPNTEIINEKILEYVHHDPRIKYYSGWVDDNELQTFFNASDLLVLPYKILNSGILILSLSFSCPVIMPINSSTNEYTRYLDGRYIFTYENHINHNVLRNAKKYAISNNIYNKSCKFSKELCWDDIARKTYILYQETKHK